MTAFCMKCGKEISDGTAFCTECGTAVLIDSTAQQPAQEQTIAKAKNIQSTTVHSQSSDNQKGKGKDGTVGTGAYFWLMFLYAIPIIGLIVCIIMAFASRNDNLKHFAKAILIWFIIGVVLSAIFYCMFLLLGNSFFSKLAF